MNVAVIGGGLSGIRAALTLARAGVQATLFEKNRHLGGRAFSFPTSDFGEVDIGQHIWLRCCTALEELLRDLEVPGDLVFRQERVAMTYRWPDGVTRTLSAGRLPGSFAMLPIFWGARLGIVDKLKLAWGSLRATLYSPKRLEALDDISFADWLQKHGQSRAVIEWFWEPVVVGVCNGRLSDVSARHGLFTMRESLLKSAEASAICFLRTPLSDVFDRRARQALKSRGVEVRTTMVAHVEPGAAVTIRDNRGQSQAFDKVVFALPLKAANAILQRNDLPPVPEEGAIAGLLLRFVRPVMDELFFMAVGSPVQFVFNKSAIWQKQEADGSQVIELVISAAEREIKLGVEQVAAELLPELAKLLPRVLETPLLAKRLLVHGAATFRVKPGRERLRPSLTQPNIPNVIFAGDYLATGWPSTMESAVRAGKMAAAAIV